MADETYASLWADRINEAYGDEIGPSGYLDTGDLRDGESEADAIRRVLMKAARCIRYGETATFTAGELELVRHLMPAHEVHQSGAVAWVNRNYGPE